LRSDLSHLIASHTFPKKADVNLMELGCAVPLTFEITPPDVAPQTGTSVNRLIQVLLVEDNREAADLVQIYLTEDEADRFRVEWTPNLRAAMSRLAEPGIDVILLDLGLPELKGYRSYRAIEAAAGEKLPVVILTSDDSSSSRDLTLGSGAAGYLLKHKSSPAQLRQALRNAVMRGRAGCLADGDS
jgi:DNA-binding response OmpR family regulator